MADYRNKGILFRNENKETEKHPDYTGKYTDENGKDFRVSAWINTGANGKYLSFQTSEDKPKEEKKPKTEAKFADFDDDDIPF